MSKYTAKQVLAQILDEQGNGCYTRTVDMLREYAAHLAAQAEWPSEEDVDAIGVALYIYWNEVNEQARDACRKKIRVALQSVRPPVGVVSDEDLLASVLTAAEDMLCFPYRGPDQDRLRAALESYASRHAPIKD